MVHNVKAVASSARGFWEVASHKSRFFWHLQNIFARSFRLSQQTAVLDVSGQHLRQHRLWPIWVRVQSESVCLRPGAASSVLVRCAVFFLGRPSLVVNSLFDQTEPSHLDQTSRNAGTRRVRMGHTPVFPTRNTFVHVLVASVTSSKNAPSSDARSP